MGDERVPPCPAQRRRLVLAPGEQLSIIEDNWRGALVRVETGVVALHCHRGGSRAFAAGSIIWFEGLGLRFVRNPGSDDAVLLTFARPAENGTPAGHSPTTPSIR